MNSESKKIAVLTSSTLHGARTFLSGVANWAKRHAHWRLMVREGRPGEQRFDPLRFGLDGVIACCDDLASLRKLHAKGVPIVLCDPFPSDLSKLGTLRDVPSVKMDSRAVGVLAAEYFLERKYASFAYVAETSALSWSAERRDGFTGRLAEAGFTCTTYDGFSKREKQNWLVERPRMMRWLGALPKPTAIFAAMDGRARLVLDACAEAGVVVPNEIAVLGVDNDPLICETSYPSLSSIRTGGFRRGEQAAGVLAALMSGASIPETHKYVEPFAVVTRESTGHDAMRNPLLAKALVFIWAHAGSERCSVSDVVAEMGCSRRLAEMLFAERIGRTVKEEIDRVKFDRVKALLRETNLPVSEIADRCGFSCESHLSFRFAKRFGLSMTDWRRRHGWNAPPAGAALRMRNA